MVYVGSHLPASPRGSSAADIPAPCLINPSLKVAHSRGDATDDIGYWPSYADITPQHRLAYLHWLSSGRCDPAAPLGYPFLYFYGLERRLLVDRPPPDEEELLAAEVERLRGIYGSNHSFAHYSGALLQLIDLCRIVARDPGLDAWHPDLDNIGREMSLPLRLKLAVMAATGTPVDFEHAIAAILSMQPFQGGIRQGISVTRVRSEFIELARRRFAERFPKGFRLHGRKDSQLMLGYHAASRYLQVDVRIRGVSRFPDPMTLTWTKMAELCTEAAEDLSSYARLVGKGRTRADSVEAALALPPEFGDTDALVRFRGWLEELPGPVAEVPLQALGSRCFGEGREVAGLKQAREISAMLARFGFGMEPDPTHGAEKPDNRVALFHVADASGAVPAPGPAFHRAALVAVVLASAGSGPDGGTRVISELARRSCLSHAEAIRLAARYRLVRGRSLSASRLKGLTHALPREEGVAVAALAAATVASCGEVEHATVAALERLYDALGLDCRELYAALHQGAASAAPRAVEPVVIEQHASRGRGHRIPPAPAPAEPRLSDDLVIDMARVDAILRETREVAEVLTPIYQDEEPIPAVPIIKHESVAINSRFSGLETEHARLLEVLCGQERCSRAEFEARARGFGLMPDGAIETMNEWAYDALGDELIEDGDPLCINVALLPSAPGDAT